MSDSLILDTVELINSDPTAVGVHLADVHDLGDPQVITAAVASILLDGERVTATRAANRTITLPVVVRGSSRLNLAARVDALLRVLNTDGYTITWTPDGGLPLVWDCFVGQGVVHWDRATEGEFTQQLDLTIPALPYGRSDTPDAPTLTAASSTFQAQMYALTGVKGSARAPVAATITFGSPVSSWLLHLPPDDADPAAPILTTVTGTTSPQTVTVAGAEKLRGTYTVVLGVQTYNAPGQPRTMTVQAAQSGTSVTQTIRKAYTSELNLRPLVVGQITLPLIDRPAGATASVTFTISDTGGGGTGDTIVLALMLLDSRGQTVMSLSQPDGVADTAKAWIDEPDVGAAAGKVWNATGSTRASAYAVAEPRMFGGALTISEDSNGQQLLAYGDQGLPSVGLAYSPRWIAERVL